MTPIIFLLFTFIFLFSLISSNTDIFISNALQRVAQENSTLFYYTAKLPNQFSYLFFRVTSLDESTFARIYVSAKTSSPDYDYSEYKGIEQNNTVYYPASELKGFREISVCIECNDNCSSILEYRYIEKDGYVEIDESNTKFDVRIAEDDYFFLTYKISEDTTKRTFLSVTSSGITEFTPFLVYGSNHFEESEEIKMEKLFFNGYGIVIGGSTFKPSPDSSLFLWISSLKVNDIFTFEVKQLNDNQQGGTPSIYPTQIVTSVIGYSDYMEDCFALTHDFTEIDGSEKKSIHYIAHGYSYTKNAILYLYEIGKGIASQKTFKGSDYFEFDINKETADSFLLCVSTPTIQNTKLKEIGSLQFQYFDSEKIEDISIQPYLFFLVRGLPLVSKLRAGTCAYYQVTTYEMNSTQLQAQLRSLEGNPQLYMGISIDYPNEVILSDEIDERVEAEEFLLTNEINGNFFAKMDIDGKNSYKVGDPVIAIVDCPYDDFFPEDCVYSITLNNERDHIVLLDNIKFSTSVRKDEIQGYRFDINTTIVEHLRIVLYSFSGDADLKAFTYEGDTTFLFEIDTKHYYAVGNKEYYDLTFDKTASGMQSYYLEVKGKTNSYYTIYFYTNNKDDNTIYLESGEMTTEAINPNGTTRLYFKNRDQELAPDYVITIQSMNCELNIKAHGEEEKYKTREFKHFLNPTKAEYSNDYYNINVTVPDSKLDTNSNLDYCLVYIASGEQDTDRVIVLNEGIPHTMKLSPDIEDMTYLYPFQPRDGGDFYNELILSIKKLSAYEMNVTYQIGSLEPKTIPVSTYDKRVIIPSEDIINECTLDLCPILIDVARVDDTTTINYEITIIGTTPAPIYLPRGEYRFDAVKSFEQRAFYTEFSNKDEGEIVVNFKRGTGSIIAAMYSKEDRDPNGWNRRFPIPDKYSTYLIPFDHDNKKFVIDTNKTSICGPRGCIVIVVIETKDSPSKVIRKRLNEFSIFTRLKKSTVVNLPENEYAFGSLLPGSILDDMFVVTIEKNTNKIFIVFDSEICGLNVTLLPRDEKDFENKKEWNIKGFESYTEITASIINDSTLQGRQFYLRPILDEINYEDDIHYSLKVVSPEINNGKIFLESNSNQNEFCHYSMNQGECYFIIPLYEYYQTEFIHLFVLNELNPSISNPITARVISQDEYEYARTHQKLLDYFPTDGNGTSSKNDIHPDTLFLPLHQYEDQTIYIMVKVLKIQGAITFMSSFYSAWDKTYALPGSHELFRLEMNSKTELTLPGTDGYFVEVVVISGIGTISSKGFDSITLEDEGRDSAAFIIPFGRPDSIVTIRSNEEDELLFYVRYLSRPYERNIDKVLFGDSNYIIYPQNRLVNFPLIFYLDATELDYDLDLVISVQFNNIDLISSRLTLDETFEVSLKYFNESTLSKFISGEDNDFPEKSTIPYDPFFKVATGLFKEGSIRKILGRHKYVAMEIKPSSFNKNLYINVQVNVICYLNYESYVSTEVPKREYYFSTIEEEKYQTHKLVKGSLDDVFYNIEFISDLKSFSIVFTNEEIRRPTEDRGVINDGPVELKGKYFYTVGLENPNDRFIMMSISHLNSIPLRYVLKYETTPIDLNGTIFIVSDPRIFYKEHNNIVTLNLTTVKTKSGHIPDKTIYTVRVYKEKSVTITDLNKFYCSKPPLYTYTKINELQEDIVSLTFSIPEGKYVASVMASVNYGYENEFLQYDSFEFESKNVLENKDYSSIIIVIAIFVCLILLVIAIIFIIYKKKGSSSKKNVIDEDTIHQINSVNDNSSTSQQLIP